MSTVAAVECGTRAVPSAGTTTPFVLSCATASLGIESRSSAMAGLRTSFVQFTALANASDNAALH